jgi:DNA polymerase-3 subunit delta
MTKGGMSPAKFLEAVRKGRRFETVWLRGDEEYLLREALQEFLAKTVPPECAGLDYGELRAGELTGESLWNALTTMPLMGERRVIVLDLNGGARKDVGEALSKYLHRPSPTTVLVLVSSETGSVDWGEKRPSGLVEVEFAALREPERTAWVEEYAKHNDKKLEPDAARYLIETSSKSLSDLAAKLRHAILFIGDERNIAVQTLMKVSGVSSEFTVFNLEDAILGRKAREAESIARSLLEGGEALLRLLAFHRGTLMRLWQTYGALHKRPPWGSDEIDRFLREQFGRQAFKVHSFRVAAQHFQERQLRRAVEGLLALEVEAKSGTHEVHQYFEWLWSVCSNGWNPAEPDFPHLR